METIITGKHPSRLQGDLLADEAFLWVRENPTKAAILHQIKLNQDLTKAFAGYGKLSDLIRAIDIPEWTDQSTLQKGSKFFQQYTLDILSMLGLYSLPYCYAGANGVRVLYLSKKIKEAPEKRLMDTAGFVFDVCGGGAFSHEGKGMVAVLKIRMLHAAARFYSKQKITDEEPVNQEDMLGTMLAFSLIVIRGLRKTGIAVSDSAAGSYLHLWKVIGYLMGIDLKYLPDNIREASTLERQVRKREFKYSMEAEELTAALMNYMNAQYSGIIGITPTQLMYYLLGKEVAGCLGLNPVFDVNLKVVEAVGRTRNAFRMFSESNYPKVVSQFRRTMPEERSHSGNNFRKVSK